MAKKRTQYRDAVEFMRNGDIDMPGNGNPFFIDPEIEGQKTNAEQKNESQRRERRMREEGITDEDIADTRYD
jgi:uncharacterized membrane protein